MHKHSIHTDEASLDHALIAAAMMFVALGYDLGHETLSVNGDTEQGAIVFGQDRKTARVPRIDVTVGDQEPQGRPVAYILPNSYTAIQRTIQRNIPTDNYLVVLQPGTALRMIDVRSVLGDKCSDASALASPPALRALDAGLLNLGRPKDALDLMSDLANEIKVAL